MRRSPYVDTRMLSALERSYAKQSQLPLKRHAQPLTCKQSVSAGELEDVTNFEGSSGS
jgi:hypothetical protein